MCFRYPSCKEPPESVCKEEAKLTFKSTSQLRYFSQDRLPVSASYVINVNGPWLAALCCGGVKRKHVVRRKKAFHVVFCPSFNTTVPSSSDETPLIAAPRRICLVQPWFTTRCSFVFPLLPALPVVAYHFGKRSLKSKKDTNHHRAH